MSTKWKTVRVFISSTFRDMHAERDHLVKVVFPRLRQWCEERRLHLVDIDLRWGVTKEQAENGAAIDICLDEIDGSRPFFACMLGGRYGWVPDRLPSDEMLRFRMVEGRWLRVESQKENTEGPLLVALDPRRSTLSPRQHIVQIRSAAKHPREERLLDDERAAHETFIENRTQIHVPRTDAERALSEYVQNDDRRPLVLSGPPGSGKSAILAHWVRAGLESCEFVRTGDTAFPPQTPPAADAPLVLARFVGASPHSTNLARLLGNVCEELRRRFDLQEEVFVDEPAPGGGTQKVKRTHPMQVPADPNEVLRKWPQFLTAASGRGRVVIVFDAINQLDRTTDASRLYWMARELPPGIKLILSVLDHGPRSLPDASFNRDPTGSASPEPPEIGSPCCDG